MSFDSKSTPIVADDYGEVTMPPRMSVWNGALRFGLEVAALVGIGRFGYQVPNNHNNHNHTGWSVVLAIACPLLASALWVTCNIPGDPSRSGAAPLVLPRGSYRLLLEAFVLGWGGYGLACWNATAGGIYGGLVVVHYVAYRKRITWLLEQAPLQRQDSGRAIIQ